MLAAPRWPPAISVPSLETVFEVLSAGSEPADQVNPTAVQAMAEEGIDIAGAIPEDSHD